jgi:hypothetical protein
MSARSPTTLMPLDPLPRMTPDHAGLADPGHDLVAAECLELLGRRVPAVR